MANRPPVPPMEHRPAMRPPPPRPGSRPPPPPGIRPPGAPGQGQPFPPGQQFPIRPAPPITSTQYVDLTPKPQLNEDTCKKKLTSYQAISIRKAGAVDSKKDKPTWAKTEHTREAISQEEIAKQIKKLNEGESVTAKKQKLRHFQQSQVNSVLDNLKNAEQNGDFEWSLAQIDQKFQPVTEKGKKKKETTVITVYAKRAVRSDLNAFQVYTFQERMKHERTMAARPPQQMAEPIRVNNVAQPIQIRNGRGRRRHDDSSSYTESNSDSDSGSYSSSDNTSISSRPRSKHYHRGRRGRSHSRRREHNRRGSYITGAPRSPILPMHHIPYAVPEPPRAIATTEEVAAAYRRGRIDSDAEHLGAIDTLVRRRPLIYNGIADPRYAEDRYTDELRPVDEDRMRRREMDLNRVYDRTRIIQPHPFAPAPRYPDW